MKPAGHDVYLCCPERGEHGMASEVVSGLARLGFRVAVSAPAGAGASLQQRQQAIEAAPDFVLLSSPGAPDDDRGGPSDPRAADLRHAVATGRNVIVLSDPCDEDPLTAAGGPGAPRFAAWQRIAYDSGRPRESVALVAHRLHSSSEVEDRRFMDRVRQAAVAVAVMLALAVGLKAVPAAVRWWNRPTAPPPLPRFTIYWAAFGQRMQDGRSSGVRIVDGASLGGLDGVRIAFSTGSDGFAYVLLRDTKGSIATLYPGAAVRGASRVRAGAVYWAPDDDGWHSVDPGAGLAAIYLFAGHEPLENLEEIVEEAESGFSRAERVELLASTLAGLLDGTHTSAPGRVRTRGGREVLGGLLPAPPPPAWPVAAPAGGRSPAAPAVRTGLLSAVVEIRTQDAPEPGSTRRAP